MSYVAEVSTRLRMTQARETSSREPETPDQLGRPNPLYQTLIALGRALSVRSMFGRVPGANL